METMARLTLWLGVLASVCGCDATVGPCVVDPLAVELSEPFTGSYAIGIASGDARAAVLCTLAEDGTGTLTILEEGGLGEGSIDCRADGFSLEPSQDGAHTFSVEGGEEPRTGEAERDVELRGGCPAGYGAPVQIEVQEDESA